MVSSGNDSGQDEFARRLAALREAYLTSLPDKISRIEDNWASLRTLPRFTAELVQPLRAEAHKLAGSGASYGLPALSACMRNIESRLDELMKFPEEGQRLVLELDELVDQARQSIDDSESEEESEAEGERSHKASRKIQRPDHPRVLCVCPPTSVLRRHSEQIRHYGYELSVCEAEQAKAVCREREPHIVLFSEEADHSAIEPLQLNSGHPPVVIVLHPRPELMNRVRAWRKGVREVLSLETGAAELLEHLDACFQKDQESPYRILFLDDDADLERYASELRQQGNLEVKTARNVSEAQTLLSEFHPDVIVMELHLGDCNGIELAAAIRQERSFKEVPIIFASQAQDLTSQMSAIRAGGDDFLVKPIPVPFLLASLEARARRGRELRNLLHLDGLTGLLNHRATTERLQQVHARCERGEGEFVVVMLDLDRFKRVNDTWGHVMGDRVLVNFSRFLKGRIRKSDILGRYGGEEFMIIFVDSSLSIARAVVESLRESFASMDHQPEGEPLHVTFSAGMAAYPRFGSPIELTQAADAALYEAKQNGRNCSVEARSDILDSAVEAAVTDQP